MRALVVSFFVFAFLGVGVEIIFTSIFGHLKKRSIGEIDWSLRGQSYLWMFPIYGCLAVFFPMVRDIASEWNILFRGIFYGVWVLIFEFGAGLLLERCTGVCPWKYTNGWHVRGYAKLDYLPLWMIFGLFVEWIYLNCLRTQ